MANSGIVKFLIGEVKALAVDGTERVLLVGEKVSLNEQIITGNSGVIAIDFSDGTRMDLGRDSSITLTQDLLNSASANDQQPSSLEDEVEAVQQALANDQSFDPSILEATAAGGTQESGELEDDGQSIVEVDYLNPAITPDSGFETVGVNNVDSLVLDLTKAEFILQPRVGLVESGIGLINPTLQVTDHKIDLAVADNSIAENATTPVSGIFIVTTPEGLASLTVGEENILEADLLNSSASPININTVLGTLTINGFDETTGTVGYEYLQKGSHKDHVNSDESFIDHFTITVTDDKNVTSAPDVLDILITDTEPVAYDNVEILTDAIADQSVPGRYWHKDNVINNARNGSDSAIDDDLGADGAVLKSVSYQGSTKEFLDPADVITINSNEVIQFDTNKGRLYVREDGEYWYHNTTPLGGGSDTFKYELVDGDGDVSSANLTISQVIGDVGTGDTSV